MESRTPVSAIRRLIAVAVLIMLGVISLPMVAAVIDTIDENLIAPVHIALMLATGVGLWTLVPGVASPDQSTARGVAVGAAVGFVGAVAAYLLFFWMLSGPSGA